MKSVLKLRPVKYALIAIAAILLAAGGMQLYSHFSGNIAQGVVSSVSVQFSGESAQSATVQLDEAPVSSATASISSVPHINDHVLLTKSGDTWKIHQLGVMGARLFYPLTSGIPLTGVLIAIVVGITLFSVRPGRVAARASGGARLESEESAEASAETSSLETRTS